MKLRGVVRLAAVLTGVTLMLSVKMSVAPLELFRWAGILGMSARETAAVSGLAMMVVGLAFVSSSEKHSSRMP
ncbi:MAG: hypothetical protein DRK00_08905 [Thermoprotei archaeon]|nr:MAG: hypothetical protein DRK00_08905 [Thermoprotei archaeon]